MMSAPFTPQSDLQPIYKHRKWLERCGLLGRTWFVLGSAPNPTRPSKLPSDVVHVHIKYAGRSAKMLGMPNADLTFLMDVPTPQQVDGLVFHRILRVTSRRGQLRRNRWRRLLPIPASKEMHFNKAERDAICDDILDGVYSNTGVEARPSNGIVLIRYALAMGVPEIVVAGILIELRRSLLQSRRSGAAAQGGGRGFPAMDRVAT